MSMSQVVLKQNKNRKVAKKGTIGGLERVRCTEMYLVLSIRGTEQNEGMRWGWDRMMCIRKPAIMK